MKRRLQFHVAQKSDVEALTVIRRDAILFLAALTIGKSKAQAWADRSGEERVLRAITQNEVWIADYEGSQEGWIEIMQNHINGLYVRADSGGFGVGSALLQHAKSLISSRGHLTTTLNASPNAEPFYSKHGYIAQAARDIDNGRKMMKFLSIESNWP